MTLTILARAAGTLTCRYTDLCAEVYPGAPFANGRPGITAEFPFDNTSFPEWKALELRRAYWASLSCVANGASSASSAI